MSGEPQDGEGALGPWLRARGHLELDPDAIAIERIRTSTQAAFLRARAADARSAPDTGPASDRTRRGTSRSRSAGVRRRPGRPYAAVAFAALLTIGSVAGPAWVFASQSSPGRPLYGARLAAEAIGLPAEGTSERVMAEVSRLERRVEEAREEIAATDWAGAEAAVAAAADVAHALDHALSAAPAARPAVRARVREVRRTIVALATDARAPGSLRAAAHRADEALERQALGRHATRRR